MGGEARERGWGREVGGEGKEKGGRREKVMKNCCKKGKKKERGTWGWRRKRRRGGRMGGRLGNG